MAVSAASAHQPVRIPIENTFNFRDIGGWATRSGTVRTRHVFRSDGLGNLTSTSRSQLLELGISTVIDLREERERNVAPDALDGLEISHELIPLFGDRLYPMDRSRTDRISRGAISLPELYELAVSEFGPAIVRAITTVAHSDGPVLFHCSAGKDRTGLIAAFILEVLGVSRIDTVSDYAATERFLGDGFLAAISANFADAGIVANLSATATQAPREYMDSLLARVDAEFGTVEGYLRAHGMAESDVATLRARLVDERQSA